MGHFLALDHIGHSTSSVTGAGFGERKGRISGLVDEVIGVMGHGQVLVVTGDHGMRDDGNHGGSSREETESFVFVYSGGEQLVETGEGGAGE